MMFETERLIIKPFEPEYFVAISNLFCNNEKVMKSAFKGRVFSQKELLSFIAEKFAISSSEIGMLSLFEKESDKFIGVTGLIPCEYLGESDHEFGFILDDQYWGKGLGHEVGQFCIDSAREHHQLHRVLAVTNPDNIPAKKLLEKLGGTLIKTINVEDRGPRLLFKFEINH